MSTFADHVIRFNNQLAFTGTLPEGIRMMNPFRENEEALRVSETFYRKFYSDTKERKLILGINPGRLGAGATGIPFTDTKRLAATCHIPITSVSTHEPSSVFIYDLIERYGGPEKFYGDYYIHSMCPLGFIARTEKGSWVNCNYYDQAELFLAVKDFMISSLKIQLGFGIDTSACFVLGKKNATYLKSINGQEELFGSVTVFEHPRYIEQYRSKHRDHYLKDFLQKLKG